MPRFARRRAPGALVHTIVRFVNGEFRLLDPAQRIAVLERLAKALARTDWTLHAYALMSSHVHLALVAGHAPAAAWLKPWLVSVARLLNREQQRFGPVVAERATTVILPLHAMATLVRYVHNNPVRAGVVASAAESDWTSHRAWIGLAPSPPWLAVDAGLRAAGFDSTDDGRDAFDRFVQAAGGEPRDPALSGRTMHDARVKARAATALPLEISAPAIPGVGGRARHEMMAGGRVWIAPRWDGDLARVVAAAARAMGCTVEEIQSRSRRRVASAARRVVVVAGVWLLRRRVSELAAAIGVSIGGACRMQQGGERVLAVAKRVAAEMRAGQCGETERAVRRGDGAGAKDARGEGRRANAERGDREPAGRGHRGGGGRREAQDVSTVPAAPVPAVPDAQDVSTVPAAPDAQDVSTVPAPVPALRSRRDTICPMNLPAGPSIYVDIDDTLVRSVGAKRIPIPATAALVRQLARNGATLYAWSTAGAAYAEQSARELGLAESFVGFLPKPVALIDDREVKDWRLLELHPAQCSATTADDLLAQLRGSPR